MAKNSMEARLWSAANGITAFSVIQAIAFLYSGAKDELKALKLPGAPILLGVLGVVCALMYAMGVWQCYRLAKPLITEQQEIWRETTKGRLAVIIVFQLTCLVGLWYFS